MVQGDGLHRQLQWAIATYINPRVYNYGPAGFDRRLNLTINFLWDIPSVSKIVTNRIAHWTLDNCQISGIASFISGAPMTLGFSRSMARTLRAGAIRLESCSHAIP
jgi:hypothetical protein